jgi:hypothetical protein
VKSCPYGLLYDVDVVRTGRAGWFMSLLPSAAQAPRVAFSLRRSVLHVYYLHIISNKWTHIDFPLSCQVKYKRDFEESKGRGFSIVTDTPELQRLKRTQEQISNVGALLLDGEVALECVSG